MAGVLDTVNQRTQLVGQNRLELLLFQLNSKQRYGINVFKVREVIRCLPLTQIPNRNPLVCGISHIRGVSIPVIDLNMAIGGFKVEDPKSCYIVITEYNQTIQGFLVKSVEKIVNMKWEAIHPPPAGIKGNLSYLTAVTEIDNQLVEIIDVEKILQEITPLSTDIGDRSEEINAVKTLTSRKVLVIDDSSVARMQIKKTLEQLGIEVVLKENGREGLEYLKLLSQSEEKVSSQLFFIISDVEMPEMDGYTLTTECRADPLLKDLYIVLHTSLSGVFNSALIEKVGANRFLPKFKANSIADLVADRLNLKK